ncbi:MAG: hypothetical protein IKH36_02570, partial [Bacilli bacterium]|nr:hypothetical protein [Bacilli bacterium]
MSDILEKEKKNLLKINKKKGYVTADDLNKIFENEDISAEEIDNIYQFISDNNIDIVEEEMDEPKLPKGKKKVDEYHEIKTLEDRKKDLLELGTSVGYLTFEQLATALKGLEMDAESLDDLYNFLRDNNIEVIEEGEDDEDPEGG